MADYSSNNKRIAKNTFFLYFRSIILMGVALYTSRIVLQALGIEDYGIYNIVGGVVAMFSILSSTLSSASQRFITYALGGNDFNNIKKVFSTCITLHIVLGIIVVILLEVIGVWFLNTQLNIPEQRLEIAHWVFQLSIITFFINVISVPYNAIIIAHERMSAFAYISIIDGLLKLGIAFSIQFINFDKLLLFAILHAVEAIAIRVIYSQYCIRNFAETRNILLRIDKQLFKNMFSFSGWNLIGSGALVLRNQGIDILINIFFGISVNAAKGICNQVQSAVHQFVGNFTSSVTPQLTKSIAQKDFNRTKTLLIHGSRFAFFMMMIFALPLMTYSNEILSIWLVKVPDYTAEMVNLVMIYLLSDSMSRFCINTLLAFGDIRNFQVTIGGIKLLTLPITYIFLKFGGDPLTGLWVNILLEFICTVFRLLFIKHKLEFSISTYFYKVFIPCWTTFAIAYILNICIYFYILNNVYLGCCISLFITIICIGIFLNKNERSLIVNFLNKKLKK